jgi:SPP1 gp7 family putative phage head morphogenesis protein
MKIGRFNISLAKKPAPAVQSEVGSSKTINSYFGGETFDPDKVKIKDLIKMRKTDGTATALYNIMTMPIKANPSSIEPADDSPEAKKQAEFVKGVLYSPPHEGGMSTPFDLVLADMLRAIVEGYRVYEKVFAIQDGKVVYKKIAIRDNQSVTLATDERGGFAGFKQYAMIGDKLELVSIPVERAFLFTFGKEHNQLSGESAFRAAYYHFDKKHRLYYLAHEAAQQFAIPPKLVTAKENATDDAIQHAADQVGQLGVNAAVGLPNGYDAKVLSSTGRYDIEPLINHHNAEMARSVLAQFMMLGTGTSTGSWALSNDQTDMFILALRSVLHQVESHVNSYLIPDLIDYNFEKPMYPKFEFSDITESTQNLLRDIALKLMEQKPEGIPDWLMSESVKQLAAQLDIEVPEEEGETASTDPAMSYKPRATQFADMKWKRPLTPAEGKVNFTGIQRKYDQLEEDFAQTVKPVWDKVRANTVKDLRKLLEKGDLKALDSFVIPGLAEYEAELLKSMLDAYSYAKVGAADEMERKAPANKAETKELLKRQAQSIVEKQSADLLFEIRNTVNTAKRKNQLSTTSLSIGDVLTTVGSLFGSFLADKVKLGVATAIAIAVNAGRDDVFTTYRNIISKYQYSALLDDVTCPICEDLDGSVVDESEYRETDWLPPVHLNCRCIWVEIMEVETEQPEITGLPAEPGGTPAPALSKTNEWGKQINLAELMEQAVDKKIGSALDEILKDTGDESEAE